ncbi:hypothetical protein Pelo_15872 [Pelomyxa schiedti]|nr:hypothetical protein Pelo_15872 [Pelomyxa schiedti]
MSTYQAAMWDSPVTEVVYALEGDFVGFLQLKQGPIVVASAGSPVDRPEKSFKLDTFDFITEVNRRQGKVLDYIEFITSQNLVYPVGRSTGGEPLKPHTDSDLVLKSSNLKGKHPLGALYTANLETTTWKPRSELYAKFLQAVMDIPPSIGTPPNQILSTPATTCSEINTVGVSHSHQAVTHMLVFSDLHLGCFPPFAPAKMGIQSPVRTIEVLRQGLFSWFNRKTGGTPPASLPSQLQVVMAGDIFDLWAQPMDILFSSLSDIQEFDPRVWSTQERISAETKTYLEYLAEHLEVFNLKAASALFKDTVETLAVRGVKFFYVTGNHDMTVTREDIDEFFGPGRVEYKDGQYTSPNGTVIVEHGHAKDIFDMKVTPDGPFGVFPFGFFVTKVRTTADIAVRQEGTSKPPREKLANTIAYSFEAGFAQEILGGHRPARVLNLNFDSCAWSALLGLVMFVANNKKPLDMELRLKIPRPNQEPIEESFGNVVERYSDFMGALLPKLRLDGIRTTEYETLLEEDRDKHTNFDTLLSVIPKLSPLLLSESADQYAAELLKGPHTACVVLGHTHCALARVFQPQKIYLNSGTTKRVNKATVVEVSYNTQEVISYSRPHVLLHENS